MSVSSISSGISSGSGAHTAKTMRHPTAILMRTVKGKGVSFMEDDSVWHGSAPDDEQMVKAIAEIKEGGVV